jgi:catechol 2,3-dioxygenase-like lactoylglutathione lyase family enzyme
VTLVLSEGLARAASGSIAGATEVVFPVADVRAAYQALRGKGVEFTIEPRAVSGPMWAANFRDPDRHGLSIFGPEHA